MSDLAILDYARLVLIQSLPTDGWPDGYVRRADFVEALSALTLPALEKFDPKMHASQINTLVDGLFQELEDASAFPKIVDQFAGDYFSFNKDALIQFRRNNLNNNSLIESANKIGFDRFFSDVFAGFRTANSADGSTPPFDGDVFDPEAFDTGSVEGQTPIPSSTWTGLPKGFVFSEEKASALVRLLDEAESNLTGSGATQQQQAQARAYIIAMRALSEAPEPQPDVIWELLGRANNIAGLAGFFISLIGLFV